MPPKKQGDPPSDWTDSDRAALREIIEERDFDKRAEARRDRIIASVKGWALWFGAVIGGFILTKDAIAGAWTWFKHWVSGVP